MATTSKIYLMYFEPTYLKGNEMFKFFRKQKSTILEPYQGEPVTFYDDEWSLHSTYYGKKAEQQPKQKPTGDLK